MIRKVLLIIVFILFIVNIIELYILLFQDVSMYAFGSDFYSSYSLHKSFGIYLMYVIANLILTILCFSFRKRKAFYYLFIALIVMVLYPIIIK